MKQIPSQTSGNLEIDFPVIKIDRVGTLIKTSLHILFTNFTTISKIVLTVFLPVEILKNYLLYTTGTQDNMTLIIRIEMLLESVFGTLTAPALIYALMEIFRTGTAPPVNDSFRWGRRQWARIFANRFRSGLAILGGILLLVIPGIVFAIWFVLVDAIVTIEGDKEFRVLNRSRKLTEGHRWMLFFSGCCGYLLFFGVAFVSSIPLAFVDHWLVSTAIDCALDIFYQILTIIFFLAYLHLVAREKDRSHPPETGGTGVIL